MADTVAVPVCEDPALAVIDAVARVLAEVFSPDSSCPPIGGGCEVVRRFHGDGAPLSAWMSHSNTAGCEQPFLWVRLARRYRSAAFPSPTVVDDPCGHPRVIAVEIGAARCAVLDAEPPWEAYEHEFDTGLDDSWRLELALCRITKQLREQTPAVSVDAISPYGPDGGVVAWTAMLYIQL